MLSKISLTFFLFVISFSISLNQCLIQGISSEMIQKHLDHFSCKSSHHDNIDEPVHVHTHKHSEDDQEHHHNHSHVNTFSDYHLLPANELYRVIMTFLKPLPDFIFISHDSTAHLQDFFRPPISLI